MGYINEKGEWTPFGSSPVKDAYWVFVEPKHNIVMKAMQDCGCNVCKDQLRLKDAYWKMCECALCISDRTELIARGVTEQLLKHQDEMVRDMMISSASPSLTDLTSNQGD